MRRSLRAAIVLSCVLMSPGLAGAQSEESILREQPRVRAVVERYLHGLKFNDTTSLRAAFWPDAKLMWIKRDGTIGQLSQADWYKGFVANAGKEEEGTLGIESIDVSGNVASVKVVEVYPKSVYIDYLNMLRVGDEWRIVNKIYTSHPR
jgi:hypothetical protein